MTSRDFDFTNCSLYDSLGHRARLSGKLAHNRFKRFSLENISLRADTFLMLNTTRRDNPLYFGTGIGSGEVTFTG
ncbi:MAG: hypothetical protein HC817_12965, partial [Saprospiraceae bacterium]|nr:hypothetical protein [Saprospiraceae bacterium]